MFWAPFFKILLVILPGLISVAFITLLERKVLGVIGYRLGPYKVSVLGVLQPIGDAVKLSGKQINSLSNSSFTFYYFSAIVMFLSSLAFIVLIFTDPVSCSLKFSFLFLMVVLGLNSLNSMVSGWSVFSKFSLIGSLRTVCQLLSYESSLYLVLFFLFFFFQTLTVGDFSYSSQNFLILLFPLCFLFWLPCMLGELNRTPYDFSEGESELVSGFNTEFGSSCFTLIFLAEYSNIIMFCAFSSYIFFNFNLLLFFFSFFFFVIWIRGVLPRFRFDKLMMLAWKFFIPFLTCLFLLLLYFGS